MPPLPSGTVTFLFTDIEGSTALWEQHPVAMREALRTHDEILRQAIEQHDGLVFKTVGDAFCAAFETASGALLAAATAQTRLAGHDWVGLDPLRVRMALNTGEAAERDEDYFGPALNKVARLLAVGHGGQTLLSSVTEELVRRALPEGASLSDQGEHRLRDLGRPQRIFSLQLPGLRTEFPPLRSIDALPNNLPGELSSFIGRERELAEIAGLLPETRLLTLTGVGGTGKTRLALQAGADALEHYPDGVWFAPLAEQQEDLGVSRAVATAMGLREGSGRGLEDVLAEALEAKRQPILLILDNCEHLIEACARLCDRLLRAAPQLTVLATSREGLAVPGERILAVPSLDLPSGIRTGASGEAWLAELQESTGIRLFVERACAAQPSFALREDNAEAVLEICRRLDGIPLAIELAAARARALPPAKLAERLDQRFRILTGGSRTALPRQQTLAATIDWSYDLLDEAEQRVLQRLSVFVGGCTLEAAESVCAGGMVEDWAVLDLLTSLVDKSLVNLRGDDEHARYQLLETVRQYARDRLMNAGETEEYRNRHLRDLVERATDDLEARRTPDEQDRWRRRWLPEESNLTVAIEWAMGTNATEDAARLLAATYDVFHAHGRWTRSSAWIEELLSRSDAFPPSLRAALLLFASLDASALGRYEFSLDLAGRLYDLAARHDLPFWMATSEMYLGRAHFEAGELEQADRHANHALERLRTLQEDPEPLTGMFPKSLLRGVLYTKAEIATMRRDWSAAEQHRSTILSVARETGSTYVVAGALNNLANVYSDQGEVLRAQPLYEEALALIEDEEASDFKINMRSNLGRVLVMRGDLVGARGLVETALRGYREIGNRKFEANATEILGHIALLEDDFTLARERYETALSLRRAIRDISLPETLALLGMLDLAEGRWDRGLRLLGAGDGLILSLDPEHLPEGNRWLEARMADLRAAREALGEEAAEAQIEAGRKMTPEAAVAVAMETPR